MLYLLLTEDQALYGARFKKRLPNMVIVLAPEKPDPSAVRYLALWHAPSGFFRNFPNLEAVFVLGAGVDAFLRREDLPQHIPLIRLEDAGMADQMWEYAMYGLLHYQRDMDRYRAFQTRKHWMPMTPKKPSDVRVSLLGLGALGAKVAQRLSHMGYRVSGFSKSPKVLPKILTFSGQAALPEMLKETDVLFCLLPATPESTHLLNKEMLAHLPKGAAIINAGRGNLIDEAALLQSLKEDHLRFAMLDVFHTEPLPENHPFWHHPKVILTPHIAADTRAEEAAAQIADNLIALDNGKVPKGLVHRTRGY